MISLFIVLVLVLNINLPVNGSSGVSIMINGEYVQINEENAIYFDSKKMQKHKDIHLMEYATHRSRKALSFCIK